MANVPEKRLLARELRQQDNALADIARRLSGSVSTVFRYTADLRTRAAHPRYRTSKIKQNFFSAESVLEHPERLVLVGFIAADGCIARRSSGQDTLIIRLRKADRSVLELFNQQLADDSRLISESKRSYVVSFPSDRICRDLERYGIVPRKTATFTWPNELSGEAARLFILGYFYGDGCYHRYKNRDVIHFISTFAFAEGVRRFVCENRIVEHAVLSRLKRSPNYAQCVFQGRHAEALAAWLFQSTPIPLLPRKHPPMRIGGD